MRKHRNTAVMPAFLQLRDAEGSIIYDGRIDRMMVEEKHVIELSILFYNDPEPCFIHRGAVLSRIFGEIEAALNNEWRTIDQLSANINKHLSMYAARDARVVRKRKEDIHQ